MGSPLPFLRRRAACGGILLAASGLRKLRRRWIHRGQMSTRRRGNECAPERALVRSSGVGLPQTRAMRIAGLAVVFLVLGCTAGTSELPSPAERPGLERPAPIAPALAPSAEPMPAPAMTTATGALPEAAPDGQRGASGSSVEMTTVGPAAPQSDQVDPCSRGGKPAPQCLPR